MIEDVKALDIATGVLRHRLRAAEDRVNLLVKTLYRYGKHDEMCGIWVRSGTCDCGLAVMVQFASIENMADAAHTD
jgi:hypothetical protein